MKLPRLAKPLALAVGVRLREARLAHRLTLAQVAARCASHGPVIARTEAGVHSPELKPLLLHARAVGLGPLALGVVVDDVLASMGVFPKPRRVSARVALIDGRTHL